MHPFERKAVERVVGNAPCERAPIRCDLGVSLLPEERAQHQTKETVDPLALSRQVTDRIESSSYRLRQHQHTLHINDRFASTAALHPAGEEFRGGHLHPFIRGRPSSYLDSCPDHYVGRSATTAALSPCGPSSSRRPFRRSRVCTIEE